MTNKNETSKTPINSAMGDALQRAAEQNNAKTILDGKTSNVEASAEVKDETTEKPKRVTQKSRAEDAIKAAMAATTYEEVKQILTLHGTIIKKIKGAKGLKVVQNLAEQYRQEEAEAAKGSNVVVEEVTDTTAVKASEKKQVIEEANVTPIATAKTTKKVETVKPTEKPEVKPEVKPEPEIKTETKVEEKAELEVIALDINDYILPPLDVINKSKLSVVLRIDLMKVYGNSRADAFRSIALNLMEKSSMAMNSVLSDFYYGR